MDTINDTSAIGSNRRGLIERPEARRETGPNFARFLSAAANATDPDDLETYSASVLEAMLRKTYTRLGKRDGRSHVIFDLPPETPILSEQLEIFSTDMPFIVDSTLAAIRAKGGLIRFISHPVLHLDPESHRVLDADAPVTLSESLLIV